MGEKKMEIKEEVPKFVDATTQEYLVFEVDEGETFLRKEELFKKAMIVTLDKVTMKRSQRKDGTFFEKPELYFHTETMKYRLTVSATNCKQIARFFGGDSRLWNGKKVLISATRNTYNIDNKITDGYELDFKPVQ